MFFYERAKETHTTRQSNAAAMVTTPRITARVILIACLVVHLSPPMVSARGFLPNFGNGYGFLVPSPRGGLGCGYFNYINCFPQVVADLTRWSGQLQAVYASPTAYEPSTKVMIQTPKTAAAAASAVLSSAASSSSPPSSASSSGTTTVDTATSVVGGEKQQTRHHLVNRVNKNEGDFPAVFLLETRGDVFAEAGSSTCHWIPTCQNHIQYRIIKYTCHSCIRSVVHVSLEATSSPRRGRFYNNVPFIRACMHSRLFTRRVPGT